MVITKSMCKFRKLILRIFVDVPVDKRMIKDVARARHTDVNNHLLHKFLAESFHTFLGNQTETKQNFTLKLHVHV